MSTDTLLIILLIVIANGGPIIARLVFKSRYDMAVDAGRCFVDGRPLFGNSKTWRGLLSSIVLTSAVAVIVGVGFTIGVLVALGAMSGDLMASFIKRRLSMAPSSMALFLDQIPESLIPAMFLMHIYTLSWLDVTVIVVMFTCIELILSVLLYKIGIRKHPY